MVLLCEACKKLIIENYTINEPNLDEIDKILNDYVTSQNKNFYIYAINCEFYLVLDNNFKISIETSYCLNIDDINKIKRYLLYWIEYYELQGYGFCNIKEMIIKTTTDKHYMTQKYYIEHLMQMIERRLNFVIDTHPQLINALNRNKNHPLIRIYSHIRTQ